MLNSSKINSMQTKVTMMTMRNQMYSSKNNYLVLSEALGLEICLLMVVESHGDSEILVLMEHR